MSGNPGAREFGRKPCVTISFGERYLGSERFNAVYREGMELVEKTAHYLDNEGRREGKLLIGAAALAFATESMRLTTRLMNLASWLLIRRSVNSGEMSLERARKERLRLKLETIGRPSHVKAFDELPLKLQAMIEASYALHEKISKLDRLFDGGSVLAPDAPQPAPAAPADGVRSQVDRLRLVFDAKSAS